MMFDANEKARLGVEKKEEQELIFFNAYSHDDEDNLAIYNGFMNIKEVMGRGEYEVILQH